MYHELTPFFKQTTLDTLAVTLQAARLQTTTFQLYHTSTPATLVTLLKTYSTGLAVLAYSNQYSCNVISSTLATMQVAALQLARLSADTDDTGVLKLWAAQTALWQLQNNGESSSSGTQERLVMLPRLAESLALKYKDTSAEATLLYISTLTQQEKYNEIVSAILHDKSTTLLTTQQQEELLVTCYTKLQQWEAAVQIYKSLLKQHSNQWMYWKGLLQCAHRQMDGDMELVTRVIQELLETTNNESAKYPCRARSLILCELAAVQIRGDDDDSKNVTLVQNASSQQVAALQAAIVEYATAFASRASCAYSDVAPYIELLVKASDKSDCKSMLKWARQLQSENQSVSDRSMLRSYIFAVQVTFQILRLLNDTTVNEEWLPEWTELVTQWSASQTLGTAKDGENVGAVRLQMSVVSFCGMFFTHRTSYSGVLLGSKGESARRRVNTVGCAMYSLWRRHGRSAIAHGRNVARESPGQFPVQRLSQDFRHIRILSSQCSAASLAAIQGLVRQTHSTGFVFLSHFIYTCRWRYVQ